MVTSVHGKSFTLPGVIDMLTEFFEGNATSKTVSEISKILLIK